MCCILNFHWISSGYFHKTPPNPLFTRHINVIENVIIYLQPHCGHLRAWFSVSKGSQQKWTYILSIYQLFAHMFLRCVVFWPSYRNSFGRRWSFCEFFHLILLDAEAVRDTPSLSINLYLVPEKRFVDKQNKMVSFENISTIPLKGRCHQNQSIIGFQGCVPFAKLNLVFFHIVRITWLLPDIAKKFSC